VTPSTIDRLIARSAFPQVHGAAHRNVINAARIAVGAIMFYRTALIVVATYYYHPTDVAEPQITAKLLFGCGMLGLLTAYTAGFLTPLAGVAIIVVYPYFDARLLTGTLGTNVASICLIALLFLNTGDRYSIDRLLLRTQNVVGRTWRTMYAVIGTPNAVQTTRILFFAFAAYAVVSFGALFYHLSDQYWREGRTVGVMLTNAYLSRHYEWFRAWEAAAPSTHRAFSIACVAGQTFFQLAMLPLMWNQWGRRFVVAWGAMFFVISLTCLQLSYLPYLELVLWALIFVRLPLLNEPREARSQKSPLLGERARVRGSLAAITAANTQQSQHPRLVQAYTGAIAVAFALFLLTWLAPGGRAWSGHAWDKPQQYLAWVGLDAPQVFNDADLRMGERWPVIHRIDENGQRTLVPFNGNDGERLAYHKSDMLYFGNSLRWRRRMIGNDPAAYNAPGATGYEQIREVCYYDAARNGGGSATEYDVRIFENQAAHYDAESNERYTPREIMAFSIDLGARVAALADD
jgi:hypothetical protein